VLRAPLNTATIAYAALQRGDYSTAVRDAMTTVEISVRDAGGFTIDDIGTDLMRKAFHENTGPLTDQSLPRPSAKVSRISSPA
jgi:Protein of unknown function (Hypoth_ymh)